MKRFTGLAVGLLVLAAGVSQGLLAQENAPPAVTEAQRAEREQESGKKSFPIGGTVSLDQSLGAGTFVADEYVRRSAYDVSLSLSPYWRITPMMRLSAGVSFSTSLVENYDSDATYKRRTTMSDISLGLNHFKLWDIPRTGIRIGGGVSFSFPTSPQSRFRQLYLSSRATVSLSRSIGPVYLAYNLGFFKNFNRYTTPAIDQQDVGDHVVLAHYQGNEQLTTDLIAVGGNNTSFGVMNSFMASWSIYGPLSFTAMYGINNSWTYNAFPKDDLSSSYAVGGRGQRDSQQGVLDLTYQIRRELSVSLGTQTMVAPKTADNKDVVFPFLNLSNNYRNNTYFYLSVTGTL